VLDTNDNLYLSVNQDNVSVSRDGKKRWGLSFPVLIDASPVVAANDEIYFCAPWRGLMAVAGDGRQVWQINTDNDPTHGNIVASPVIGRDGTIYIGGEGCLEAINSTNHLAPLANSSWPMFRANPRHTGRVEADASP
jgi:outer membrane protein assembly factor BamB